MRQFETSRAGLERVAKRPELVVPASFAQQRLWFLDRLQPGNAIYNIPVAFRLQGRLHVEALQRALDTIVRRHEALRTVFRDVDGEAAQVVLEHGSVGLAYRDMDALDRDEREAELERQLEGATHEPFDLKQGPLLRATLVRLQPDVHVLAVVMHHTISDAWSGTVFLRELSELYTAQAEGRHPVLPELPIQYADYSVWQRERLQGSVLERQLAYWQRHLDEVPVLELPTDRVGTSAQSFLSGRQCKTLPASFSRSLRALSQRRGVTLFMTLVAAFQLLLSRLTHQEDVAVGIPIAGRTQLEVENLIGFFVNTLVLRLDLSGNPPFVDLLERVREAAMGAIEHQDVPFEKLVEELQPERDLSRNPFFDVMFNYLPGAAEPLHLGDLEVTPLPMQPAVAKFPLTLYVWVAGDSLELAAAYQTDLFDAERVASWLDQYCHLLDQISVAPERHILSYSLVTPQARGVLPDPALTIVETPQQTVVQAFDDHVAAEPDRCAVAQGEHEWTYRALASSAGRIAAGVTTMGLRPSEVVAVTGPRSFGLIAAMLGILRARAVLLPIDTELPRYRQQVMLRESGARAAVLVGHDPTPGAGREAWHGLPAMWLSTAGETLTQPSAGGGSERAYGGEPSPADPAYVFFTSGTTGTAKGVLGIHKGLIHFLSWQRDTFAVGPADRVAQLTNLSFDVVLRDIFLPLISGATLCLPGERDSADPIGWLERAQVTVVHMVPSVLQSWLIQLPGAVGLARLRWLFLAGEPLLESLVESWRAHCPCTGAIVNLYGATETTLAKCFSVLGAELAPGVQPVGQPLPQAQALVLRPDKELCGVGEPGEIVLRTPFRTRGYLNTGEELGGCFYANPFRNDNDDLVYPTGDRGRYRPDGSLEVLGRFDDQVKIRGVRVEPAEVNAVLARHDGVNACAVVARENDSGETVLVAYIVPTDSAGLDADAVRAFLGDRLPQAFIPAAFVYLKTLPLLPNGKLDRAALPQPFVAKPAAGAGFVPPDTALERRVAKIWARLLGVNEVGRYDSFFVLGGHSLLAMRVVARIEHELGIVVPLRSLFDTPALDAFSRVVASSQQTGSGEF